ncbi:WhiB family transcriptional regulator [[Mycobacterium] crassicus]|uniref:WhiB family transcriptional regulator n=1 Tax=[Mycobacterium] crassicus TaxID=2872309 RepID=A0ABU5XMP4_9MYCO|nr:WhiB family transcriptional regulator [Mycolicibacter sp. MYC098]MEB3023479.1 WhiB family transcriptional regulator [Mycolicibacter sp. MYC098]
MSISGSPAGLKPSNVDTSGRARPHQDDLSSTGIGAKPERRTPCHEDPERWWPEGQLSDPTAITACWSCFFQSRCALKALAIGAQYGIWAGYRLAPGPPLAHSRKQLAIIAGIEQGPVALPRAVKVAAQTAAAASGVREYESAPATAAVDLAAHEQLSTSVARSAPRRLFKPTPGGICQKQGCAGDPPQSSRCSTRRVGPRRRQDRAVLAK